MTWVVHQFQVYGRVFSVVSRSPAPAVLLVVFLCVCAKQNIVLLFLSARCHFSGMGACA